MTQQLDLNRAWIKREFGDEATGILRELQYYNLHGELPFDAYYIEKVEWVNDMPMIVCRDLSLRSD